MSRSIHAFMVPIVMARGLALFSLTGPCFAGAPTTTKKATSAVRQASISQPSAEKAEATTNAPKANEPQEEAPAELPSLNLIDGLRTGQLAVTAEGTGDGRMTVNVTNRTHSKLRVVLPPAWSPPARPASSAAWAVSVAGSAVAAWVAWAAAWVVWAVA